MKGLKKEAPQVEFELVLIKKEVHYKEIFDLGIKIHFIERKFTKKDPRLFFLFFMINLKFRPDIVHVWDNMNAVYAIPTKILFRQIMINSQISDAPSKVKRGLLSHALTFRFSDDIVANSYAGIESYQASAHKSTVIYNGFDFKRIKNLVSPDEIRHRCEIKTPFVVGMVASFSPLKDYETYIEAAIKILEKRNDITFLAIGKGDKSNYIKLVPSRFINKFLFFDHLNNVESYMNICNIGILATYSEGISNAILEYMALGKPVIASKGGGTTEIIKDGVSGYIVEPLQATELSGKIEFILNNKALAETMGKMGRKIVHEKFGINKMISSYLDLYYNKKI